MDEERLQRMEKEALQELLHYHDRDAKRRLKDILRKAAGRYVPPDDVIFWDTGLLANGLMELWSSGKCAGDADEVIRALRQYFDGWIERGMRIYYMDDALCGVALLRLYEVSGDKRYRAGADRLAGYLLELGGTQADAAGSIPYRPAQKNGHVYVDGIGMMCPFLAMYGVKCGNGKAVKLALTQIKNMLEYGMDTKTGLPYHGFKYEKREKYGIIGWGRAVGWLLMGMKGVLYWLEKEKRGAAREYDADNRKLWAEFFRLLEAVSRYQRTDGGFSWQLEALEGPADSSATAMIAQALRFCLEYGDKTSGRAEDMPQWEKMRGMLRSAVRFLEENEKDGRIYHCLGECMGFSQYPQVYGAYPWSLGTALEVMDGRF